MQYTFDTRAIFLLATFLKHFECIIDELSKMVQDSGGYTPGDDVLDKIGAEKFMQLIFQVVSSVSGSEKDAIALLAHVSRRQIKDVEALDGYVFVEELTEFLKSVDWSKLMGKLLGQVKLQNA